jgi:2-succinyl-5-enolpyruvyl-6-hydroxy-3-cyclohexene-1-carboxylate synthase
VARRLDGRRGVIVAGSGVDDPAAVGAAAAALGWPVLATPTSGCRSLPGAVGAFDAILRHAPSAARLRPEVVLHLGGAPASKVLGAWLAEVPDHVVADPFGQWGDPDRVASLLVAASPTSVCRAVAGLVTTPVGPRWAKEWTSAEAAAQAAVAAVLAAHAEATEPGVARTVTSILGAGDTLFVASSMPVRDVEWHGDPAMTCRVAANRGANGIDGLVSTALGLAAGSPGRTAALLGDLAFLHDSGGLLGAVHRGVDCCFVVVDNDGGGIFSFLPQSELPEQQFERFWGTPHGIDLTALAAVHGIPAVAVKEASGLAPAVRRALVEGGVQVVVVTTDRAANVAVHRELVDAVAAAIDRA